MGAGPDDSYVIATYEIIGRFLNESGDTDILPVL